MPLHLRNGTSVVLIAVAALTFDDPVRLLWMKWAVANTTVATDRDWSPLFFGAYWAPDLLISSTSAGLLVWAVRTTVPVRWCLTLAALICGLRFVFTSEHHIPVAETPVLILYYGRYAALIVGALIGGAIAAKLRQAGGRFT